MQPRSLEPTLPALARFGVYRKSLECARLIVALPVHGDLRDQLRRDAFSVSLNAAEGAGERGPAAKAKYFAIARASLWEVSAALDLVAIQLGARADVATLAGLLREIDAMLAALMRRL